MRRFEQLGLLYFERSQSAIPICRDKACLVSTARPSCRERPAREHSNCDQLKYIWGIVSDFALRISNFEIYFKLDQIALFNPIITSLSTGIG